MKEEEWHNLGRPYNILPPGTPEEYPWHIYECDKCSEVLGFEQYPHDGDVLCLECGLKEKRYREL